MELASDNRQNLDDEALGSFLKMRNMNANVGHVPRMNGIFRRQTIDYLSLAQYIYIYIYLQKYD